MSALSRYTQKIFGSSDSSQDFSQFGGFVANVTTLYSGSNITPSLVQGLSNYLVGWTNAVIGNNAFAIQDFNSLCFLFSYQLAYLFQQGIAAWDAGTAYYQNSLVQSGGALFQASQSSTNQQPGVGSSYWAPPLTVGELSQNASSGNVTAASGQTLIWPNMDIQTGDTITMSSGGFLRNNGTNIVAGTLVVSGTAVMAN